MANLALGRPDTPCLPTTDGASEQVESIYWVVYTSGTSRKWVAEMNAAATTDDKICEATSAKCLLRDSEPGETGKEVSRSVARMDGQFTYGMSFGGV